MSQLECGDVKCSTFDASLEAKGEARARPGEGQEERLHLHISKVRDYRDKFILRGLQDEARLENPGFMYLMEGKEKAKIVWARREQGMAPVGYYIYREPRREFSKHAHAVVQFPMLFSQVFVRPERRGAGLGTALTARAVRAGADAAADVWICAERDERPRRLYQRLGFNVVVETGVAILPPRR